MIADVLGYDLNFYFGPFFFFWSYSAFAVVLLLPLVFSSLPFLSLVLPSLDFRTLFLPALLFLAIFYNF